jgi:hypothetical protein
MKITPMTSTPKGVSFMVHRLGTEVGPLKQVRELIKNCFEAIATYLNVHRKDTLFKGQVEVSADVFYLKTHGVRKSAFSDNGIGLAVGELKRFFNTLAESGKRQSIDENFGVGAKISTAAWNPYGVEVRSWQDGHGNLIRIAYDAGSDQYGLEQFEMPDGTFPEYLDLSLVENPEDYKSPIIDTHGTMVVLLGKNLQHDTTLAPDSLEVTHKDYWFQHVANKQFYKIPDGITLTSKLALIDGKPHTRTIEGYASVLDEFKSKSGSLQLSDSTAHWWILDDSRSVELYRKRPYYHAFSGTKKQGHVAALYRDELFDFTSHDAAVPLLQKFGIFAGYSHVVIYVEPSVSLAVTANLTRTSLVLPDGTNLPWDRWATEFYESLPKELADHVEAHQSAASKSEEEYLKEQINKYKEFLQIKSYRVSPKGSADGTRAGDDIGSRMVSGGGRGTGRVSDALNSRRPTINIKKGLGDTKVIDLMSAFCPVYSWVTEAEASHLESRAAHFVVERSFLEVNQDFSVFQELIDHGLRLVNPDRRDAHRAKIETVAKQLYLTQLVWTVMSAMASFRHREGWRGDGFAKLVSDEALTAAVLPRVYLLNDMKRFVRGNAAMKRDLQRLEESDEEPMVVAP